MAELNKQLFCVSNGKVNDKSFVVYDNVRVSVLDERLIRVELSPNGSFADLPSQAILYRNFEPVNFTYTVNADVLTLKTDKAEFVINCHTGNFKYAKIGKEHLSYNKEHNLKGTLRTLDQTFGAKELGDGLISYDGVSIYDDSETLLIGEDGTLHKRENGTRDIYVFAFGQDYINQIRCFYKISGNVPLIPRYALGNWWSRYRAYSQQEYEELMCTFMEKDIPLTVATVDMDWHWVNIKEKFGKQEESRHGWWSEGWTGYSWNTDLFPDYKAFLKKLHNMGLKVTLNLHPADGIRWFEDMYPQMAGAMGIDPKTKKPVEFDLTDNNFINNYFDIVHHPYEKDGVDFWWIDWQQGTKSKVDGLDPLWLLNHYHYLDNASNNKRPLILSRYAGIGSHRYPLGFSGDTAMNWDVLNFQPYFTANSANCGYTWWSHDIGGHHMGDHDDELYIRWLQLGVFSPINRLHSTNWDILGKEPWNYSWEAETLGTEFLQLRHSLIPYIYSMNYRNHHSGRAICEPMYYTYPNVQEAYEIKNEFMFGSELLCCPVTSKISPKTKTAVTKVWLPEGRWTDIFNNKIYKGNQFVYVNSPINSIPVFAKEGAVIPYSEDDGNSWKCPHKLRFDIYRGNSTFSFYEDDGETNNFTRGEFSKTNISVCESHNKLTVLFKGGRDLDCIPSNRQYKLCFKDVKAFDKAAVTVNGQKAEFECFKNMIILHNVSSSDEIFVELEGIATLCNKPVDERILDAVIHLNGSNIKKNLLYKKLCRCENVRDYNKAIRLIRTKALKMLLDEAVNGME